jgi:hypothetical protein
MFPLRFSVQVFTGFALLLLFLVGSGLKASRGGDAADDVQNLVKAGNSKEIAKMMASTVEITILSDENVYSKVQAEAILKDFFLKHTPTAVKLVHKLTSNPNYRFTVLLLTTSNGIFRVSYAMKNNDGTFLLTEMRFEVNKD